MFLFVRCLFMHTTVITHNKLLLRITVVSSNYYEILSKSKDNCEARLRSRTQVKRLYVSIIIYGVNVSIRVCVLTNM